MEELRAQQMRAPFVKHFQRVPPLSPHPDMEHPFAMPMMRPGTIDMGDGMFQHHPYAQFHPAPPRPTPSHFPDNGRLPPQPHMPDSTAASARTAAQEAPRRKPGRPRKQQEEQPAAVNNLDSLLAAAELLEGASQQAPPDPPPDEGGAQNAEDHEHAAEGNTQWQEESRCEVPAGQREMPDGTILPRVPAGLMQSNWDFMIADQAATAPSYSNRDPRYDSSYAHPSWDPQGGYGPGDRHRWHPADLAASQHRWPPGDRMHYHPADRMQPSSAHTAGYDYSPAHDGPVARGDGRHGADAYSYQPVASQSTRQVMLLKRKSEFRSWDMEDEAPRHRQRSTHTRRHSPHAPEPDNVPEPAGSPPRPHLSLPARGRPDGDVRRESDFLAGPSDRSTPRDSTDTVLVRDRHGSSRETSLPCPSRLEPANGNQDPGGNGDTKQAATPRSALYGEQHANKREPAGPVDGLEEAVMHSTKRRGKSSHANAAEAQLLSSDSAASGARIEEVHLDSAAPADVPESRAGARGGADDTRVPDMDHCPAAIPGKQEDQVCIEHVPPTHGPGMPRRASF